MADKPRHAHVSCQALQVFFDYVERRGHGREELQQGLPYSPDYFERGGNWVDYATLLEIERRTATLLPDEPDLFFHIGRSAGETRSLGFLGVISHALLSPWTVYRRIPSLMRRFLFRFFRAEFERIAWNKLRGTYVFDPDCPPSDAFLETARGVLTAVPLMVGAPQAEVTVMRTAELEAVLDVTVVQWRGFIPYVRGRAGELASWRRRRGEAERDAIGELESANQQLQEKIDALIEAKTELEELRDSLARRGRERTAELELSRAALEDTVARLERTHRAKDDFFTGISHQIKTPLQLILGPIDAALEVLLVDNSNTAGAVRGHLGTARYKALELQRLVAEILDSAKLDSGHMPLEIGSFDLGAAVTSTCSGLLPLAQRKKLGWTLEVPPAPLPARADRRLVERALLNLVENAIKYSDEGDEVVIRALDVGEHWRVEVQDTGPGISADQQATVFDRFARATDARGRTIEGSGIGLALVREIAERHGGHVELDSEVGRGSTFALVLPKKRPSEGGLEQDEKLVYAADDRGLQALLPLPESLPAAHVAPAADRSGKRILVVEDHPELRAFLRQQIGRRHRILVAGDGVQAFEIARRTLPDLVLTDVMMPRMNGYQLCRTLKSDPMTANIPVILITAKHGVEAAIDGFSARADDFVPKPFALPELLARIDTQLRLRELTTSLIRAERQHMLGLLSAGIAHEVLNPVNAVINSVPHVRRHVDALQEGRPPRLDAATCGELLDAIEGAGRRIDEIVRSILTFTRSEDGPPRMRVARLSQGIRSMLSILRFRIKHGVEVHLDFDFDGEIVCHPGLLDQVMANLVVNAIDALPDGRGQVWIRTEKRGQEVVIRVRDDGPGISPEQRELIFAPFFTTKPPGRGTGLGLAIGREIVAMHGGSLELEALTEQGAEFVIRLPVREIEELET